jgi:hypothetical protein
MSRSPETNSESPHCQALKRFETWSPAKRRRGGSWLHPNPDERANPVCRDFWRNRRAG